MSKLNKKLLGRIITLGVVTLFVWYFLSNIDDFKQLLHINPLFIVLLIVVDIAGIVANGLFMKESLVLFGRHIKSHESVRVSLISSAGNFFAPAGSGLGFRAVYLKKRHKLAYSDYISIVFCNYILAFFINALLGLVALYALRQHNSPNNTVLASVFGVLLLSSLAAFFIKVKRSNRYKNEILKRVHSIMVRITEGWQIILSNKAVMVSLFGIMMFNTALMVAGTYFIMSALNVHLSLAGLVLFSAMGSLSVFINVTPGNLGVKEAIYIIFSTVIGLTTAQVLSAAIIDRTALFIVLSILWVVYGRKVYPSDKSSTTLSVHPLNR